MTATTPLTGERADLLTVLARQREFLRGTTRGLSDEQAGLRSTVSELCLGGLIKHVSWGERHWVDFIVGGPEALMSGRKPWAEWDESDYLAYREEFRMRPGETLAGLLAEYARTAERTERIVAGLRDLDVTHPLPEAPWFEPGAAWSARTALLHIIAETAQHCGHADIIREAIDGAKSMG